MVRLAAVCVVLLRLVAGAAWAQKPGLELINQPDGKLFVKPFCSEPFVTLGLEITSANGVLIPFDGAAPFAFILNNARDRITLGQLGDGVTIGPDGVVLDAGGSGGWRTGLAYDANLDFGFPPQQVFGYLAEDQCTTTLDFGSVVRGGDDGLSLISDGIVVEGFGGLKGIRITGMDSSAFSIPDFREVQLESENEYTEFFDARFNVDLAPGSYQADVTFTAEFVQIKPSPGNPFELVTEIIEKDFRLFTFRAEIIQPNGDCDGNGELNSADLSCVETVPQRDAVLDSLGTLPGDLDGNGSVEFRDFLTLSANFGRSPAAYAQGNIDLGADGVAFPDFLILSGNFGKEAEGTAAFVPEPSSGLPTGLVAFLLGLLRRRRAKE